MNNHTDVIGNFIRSPLRSGTLAFGLAIFCTGCLSTKSYVDPTFHDANYLSIRTPASPRPVVVVAMFQVNGKPKKELNSIVFRKVTKILAATRVFIQASNAQTNQAARLEITVNNITDIGSAEGKGFGTGFTLGLAGSEVVDRYEMTAIYTPSGGLPIKKIYKHAIFSTIGAHSAPKGMEPVSISDAFDQVVEDMLLNFLRDLQESGSL
ncbi:MAG TPA: hypothetical protein VIK53_05595 [Verrucomicrobiae bacterium]